MKGKWYHLTVCQSLHHKRDAKALILDSLEGKAHHNEVHQIWTVLCL